MQHITLNTISLLEIKLHLGKILLMSCWRIILEMYF